MMLRCDRKRALAVALAATGVVFGSPAGAEANFVAVAEDPAGDSADPNPGRDITAIGLSYDKRSGALIGGVRFRGDPTDEAPATVTLFAGTKTPNGCNGVPAAGFGTGTTDYEARWLRIDDAAGNGPRGDADKLGSRTAVQEFKVSDQQLAGQSLNCAIAVASQPGDAAVVYDTAGPFDLAGQPALAMKIGGIPRAFSPGRPRKVKLQLSNDGDAPTGPIRVSIGHARGLTVKTKRKVKSIAAGARATVQATVTLSGRARTVTDLKVTTSAGKLKVRGEARLVLRKPGGSGGGGGGNPSGQWCTRWIPDITGTTGGSLIHAPC